MARTEGCLKGVANWLSVFASDRSASKGAQEITCKNTIHIVSSFAGLYISLQKGMAKASVFVRQRMICVKAKSQYDSLHNLGMWPLVLSVGLGTNCSAIPPLLFPLILHSRTSVNRIENKWGVIGSNTMNRNRMGRFRFCSGV